MKFRISCGDYMEKHLSINVKEFEGYLFNRFGFDAQCIDDLVIFAINHKLRHTFSKLSCADNLITFNCFKNDCLEHMRRKCKANESLLEYGYEIICYFGWYFSGGLIELFKNRQAENEGPRIYLTCQLIEQMVLEKYLSENIVAYRGMSLEEYATGSFGMSWSLLETKAAEFAFSFYNNKPRGVVVKALIPRVKVLYYSPNDPEQEIIVENRQITQGEIIQQ